MYRSHIIIGNGPAGFTAAKAIREREHNAQILIVSAERHGFYSRPGLAYMLTGEIPESQLISHPENEYRHYGIDLLNARVRIISPATHLIQLDDGQHIRYDSLLLAMGARARRPDIPGIDLKGVVTFDSLDDTKKIIKLSRKARSAVVIGGGITALELVEGFMKRGLTVHYFLRGDRFWSKVLERHEARLVERKLAKSGVELHYRTQIQQIIGRKGRVTSIETQRGEIIRCQMVGMAVGIQPRVEMAQEAGLDTKRGVVVDEFLRTSDPNIYAAGDVAEIYNPEIDGYQIHSLWPIARDSGSIAGMNMTGARIPFINQIPYNATLLAGIPFMIIGAVGCNEKDDDVLNIVRGDSEAWRARIDAFAIKTKCQNSHLRLIVGKTHLHGALLIGDQSLSRSLRELIEEHINILPIRDKILDPSTDVEKLLLQFLERQRNLKRAG